MLQTGKIEELTRSGFVESTTKAYTSGYKNHNRERRRYGGKTSAKFER